MDNAFDVIIVGGGIAGLTAAIHLSKINYSVLLIEKNEFPKHKVCGEYISNEVIPYFEWLGLSVNSLHPTSISKLQFSTYDGKKIVKELPLGGFGISRYVIDFYMYEKARSQGCKMLKDEVKTIDLKNNIFNVETSNGTLFNAKIVLGAFGKRSTIDLFLKRDFFKIKSPWLAVKSHYSGNYNNSLVGLHNFNGGYCGVSKVENEIINVCYLVKYNSFKKFKRIEDFQENVLKRNPHLKEVLENAIPLFEKPLTISQISFENKKPVEKHIIMIGDAAGLIHPLCGNGMAMAIHSAKIASECAINYLKDNTKTREEFESSYSEEWNKNFKTRLKMGRILSRILLQPVLSSFLLRILLLFPSIFHQIIKKTHGKPINISKV